jgi:hypothetical protein
VRADPTTLSGKLLRLGEMSGDYAQPLPRGSGGGTYTRKRAQHGKPRAWSGMINQTPARDKLGAVGTGGGFRRKV